MTDVERKEKELRTKAVVDAAMSKPRPLGVNRSDATFTGASAGFGSMGREGSYQHRDQYKAKRKARRFPSKP